ncbi:MAG: homocysteine S-methyltransferase family protein [Pseudomonadota bacterium]
MAIHRSNLPQLKGNYYLTDGGLETDLIFNHGVELPAFAAHTLLESERGQQRLASYYADYLQLAGQLDRGFVLDVPTWRAQRHFAEALACTPESLQSANQRAVDFIAGLRREFATNGQPIVLNAIIGPCGDGYVADSCPTIEQAMRYHAEQIQWLANTDVDMVSALTITNAAEAAGIVNAAQQAKLPVVISFTVETDGTLPTGQPLHEAIDEVDAATQAGAAYFMLNCAHPTHFAQSLAQPTIRERVRGLRCNASTMSHAELDCCDTLDDGDPDRLAQQYTQLLDALPRLCVLGGCCGTDIRHVSAIAHAMAQATRAASAA